MTSREIRQKYLDFFKARGHAEVASAKLVLENDPTTLFTSSGMQPLVPFLLGEKHPEGKRLVNSQPSFRAEDIEEVGDNRHTTFFEMLGNWSLGEYFKKEQLSWIWEFLTKELNLPEEKLHVTIFEGNEFVPKDEESREIWKSLGISEERIYEYGVEKNWWSRFGTPDKMPSGEIGGPDSEIFYEFTQIKHDIKYGKKCHPNCECGRFLEIANSVFIQFKKTDEGKFEELPQKNVDFGGGLERLTAVVKDNPDIFQTDLYLPIIKITEKYSGKSYSSPNCIANLRIIADHLKAAAFLIVSGVIPSNKMQGYVLRRLIRRVAVKMHELRGNPKKGEIPTDAFEAAIADAVLLIYNGLFGIEEKTHRELVVRVIVEEMEKFGKSLEKGLNEVKKLDQIDGKAAFDLYQTFGFPLELTIELVKQKGQTIDRKDFEREFKKHQELSRGASVGKFAGGLAGHSEVEIKYHTATHLLHQALRDILGSEVFQKGSNITPERLRFDFSFERKMTEDEIKAVEDLVNKKIREDLKVDRKFMTFDEAKNLNAIGLFDEKYDKSNVSIYAIGPDYLLDSNAKDQRERGGYYSLEFCGGPHVEHTGVIGGIKITKEEAISEGVRRIRAKLL
ncbi:alanine--tRNA ligase [Candidatus Daviesbacteria bacterium]|nr:alanine--tRNA ligase [Candidatus Daviesbacteria bacterium]